jgi:D-alanyl-D-alanine dipeptidase
MLSDTTRDVHLRAVYARVVGSGPDGTNPHHEMDERTIQGGDMVVLDFGGLKDGYGSDTTRTVHVGEPTAEERGLRDRAPRPAGRLRGTVLHDQDRALGVT